MSTSRKPRPTEETPQLTTLRFENILPVPDAREEYYAEAVYSNPNSNQPTFVVRAYSDQKERLAKTVLDLWLEIVRPEAAALLRPGVWRRPARQQPAVDESTPPPAPEAVQDYVVFNFLPKEEAGIQPPYILLIQASSTLNSTHAYNVSSSNCSITVTADPVAGGSTSEFHVSLYDGGALPSQGDVNTIAGDGILPQRTLRGDPGATCFQLDGHGRYHFTGAIDSRTARERSRPCR